ncbi:MAG TPA: hypothetical protein VHX38_02050 [Pseudonocardiaceae bacterium]|jgi:hypothetical protein|nr:hypothetical protein [Pseudonocardiaceae bacterium]
MRLRVNPQTGQLAQRMFSGDWVTIVWIDGIGYEVHVLIPEQITDWPEVGLAPAPPQPEFHFATACVTCDPHGLLTNVHERDLRHDAHDPDHDAQRWAVRIEHPDPDAARSSVYLAGDEVAFHGSVEGEAAADVDATVWESARMPGEDGEPVAGYVVGVGERGMWVPATALVRR